ncbi:ferritin-like domain-containing protein [Chlorogloeopsis sp. ULAP01]|uniref:ferritin-like domain-containing protein n=1 Tax=Chlorogloeopsis sp. ULAP01 TaxID=3056483 RepID=UPI0025AA4A95|nr:ferritin-like domain-containing protein [Chlorogloeopsis sp. ULAP01]MDM9382301.1 ferritin-like domain-containing protein [Chlorogloeopsis sp. ULAP01]
MTNHKIAGFDLPHAHTQDKLHRVLSSALESRLGKVIRVGAGEQGSRGATRQSGKFFSLSGCPLVPLSSYWDAKHFGLNRVKIFREACVEEQIEILQLCNLGLLEEAYFIEQAGVGYMAKMVTLAETTEERMLYALFSGDEVTHLAQISQFIDTSELVGTDDPFLRLLGDLVENPDKSVLLFILQVVLEGWGLSHYRSLAKDCHSSDLSAVLWGFLQDESRHHSTGVTLFDRVAVTKSSQQTMIETLALFLQMVQVGPQSVVAAIEKVKGYLSPAQKVKIFEELDTEIHSGTRLQLLRSLMRSPNAEVIVEELEVRGAFQPFPANKCVFSGVSS